MNTLFKLRRLQGKTWEYMATEHKWTKTGKLFKEEDLTKILNTIQALEGSIPSTWEVVEYHLIQTKTLPTDKFLQYKKQRFVPKDIL